MRTTLVEITSGKVQGYEQGAITVWKGIPFAHPPIAHRRFLPPQPPQPVVLQKHKEDHLEPCYAVFQLRLDGHSEEFCDKCSLTQAVTSVHSLHLSFPDHVHCLISL